MKKLFAILFLITGTLAQAQDWPETTVPQSLPGIEARDSAYFPFAQSATDTTVLILAPGGAKVIGMSKDDFMAAANLQGVTDRGSTTTNPITVNNTDGITIEQAGQPTIILSSEDNGLIEVKEESGDWQTTITPGGINLDNGNGGTADLLISTITSHRNIHFPDKAGTLAVFSDIPTSNSDLTNDKGYITDYSVTEADVTQHEAALSINESQIPDLDHFTNADETDPIFTASEAFDIASGDISNWNEAHDNIQTYIDDTVTVDFPSIAANSSADETATVTGLEVGDQVLMTPDKDAYSDAGLTYNAWVNGANTLAIRVTNATTGAIDPVSSDFYITILKR